MELFVKVMNVVNDIVWHPVMCVFLMFAALWFTFHLRGMQVRRFGDMFKCLTEKGDNKKEETLSCKNIKYQLSKYECSILSLLIRSELNRVPVWLVIEKVWQNKVDVDVKTVSLYVSYVNRKLKALDSKAYIKFDEENIELCVNI